MATRNLSYAHEELFPARSPYIGILDRLSDDLAAIGKALAEPEKKKFRAACAKVFESLDVTIPVDRLLAYEMIYLIVQIPVPEAANQLAVIEGESRRLGLDVLAGLARDAAEPLLRIPPAVKVQSGATLEA
jgi:hypothetical protein